MVKLVALFWRWEKFQKVIWIFLEMVHHELPLFFLLQLIISQKGHIRLLSWPWVFNLLIYHGYLPETRLLIKLHLHSFLVHIMSKKNFYFLWINKTQHEFVSSVVNLRASSLLLFLDHSIELLNRLDIFFFEIQLWVVLSHIFSAMRPL
jgi:hypothetical protein